MKRGFFVLLSFALLASVFITPLSSNAQAATQGTQGNVRNLGSPHHTIGIYSSAYGEGPNGTQVTFVASTGVFNVINTVTGERIASHPLKSASAIWGTVVDPSGMVYFADNTNLFRYNPKTDVLEDLGRATETEAAIWKITSDENGRIYGGTWPNGKVFMYDPETDSFTDYGQMAEGSGYVRDVQVYNGKLYVGVGIIQHLIEFDPVTKEKNEIALPVKNQTEGTPYDVDIRGDYLFTRLENSSSLLVYDLKNKTWVDEITQVKGSMVSAPGPDNKVYFHKGNTIHSYDLDTLELTATELNDTWSSKGFGWIELDEPGFEGLNLTSLRFNGTYWIYNPASGQTKEMTAQVQGEPFSIHSIALGPDGKIYTSGYHAGGFAHYSPSADKITSFTGFGQAENIMATENYLYLGVYPGAHIYKYDPTLPYEHDPTVPEKQTNPTILFSLNDIEQDRPFAFAEGDGKVFIGTVPDYGVLGGTLSILNEATGEHESFRDVVKDHSIISLQYKDGLIYGGTSVFGGLDSTPTAAEAKLFIFDPKTKEKVYEGTPIPGERAIGALEFDDEGYLWGMTRGKIFKFDPVSREVIKSKELFSYSWDGVGHHWKGAFLDFDQDGNFYGTSLGNLFKFNPDNWELEILDNNASLYAKDEEGNLYFSRGSELFVYVRDGDGATPPQTTKVDVNIKNPSFEEPLDEGVIPGWSYTWDSENATFTVTDVRSFSGDKSLYLEDTSQTGSVAVISDPIKVIPGQNYTAKSQVYFEDGDSATFILRFFDEKGNQIDDAPVYISGGKGSWQEVVASKRAPKNAVTARIYANVSVIGKATAYYDAIELSYDAYATAPEVMEANNGSLFTAETNPTITVKGDKGSTIYVYNGDEVIATINGTGEEQTIQLKGLIEGEYPLTIRAFYKDGIVSLDRELLVVVDQTAPDAPHVLDPVRPLSTNNRTPEITFETEPGATVIIVDNGKNVGMGEADETGIAVVKTESLTQGIHKMKAYVVDKAGNESALAAIPHIIINNGKKPN